MAKKKVILDIGVIAILIVLIIFVNRTDTSLPEIYEWGGVSDYSAAHAIAKESQQPLIVYFHVDWCGFCKKLNEIYLENDQVYDFLSDYRMIQIDPEEGEEHRRIADLYGVKGYPSFFVSHPHNGSRFKIQPFKKEGAWTVEEFLSMLERAVGN